MSCEMVRVGERSRYETKSLLLFLLQLQSVDCLLSPARRSHRIHTRNTYLFSHATTWHGFRTAITVGSQADSAVFSLDYIRCD